MGREAQHGRNGPLSFGGRRLARPLQDGGHHDRPPRKNYASPDPHVGGLASPDLREGAPPRPSPAKGPTRPMVVGLRETENILGQKLLAGVAPGSQGRRDHPPPLYGDGVGDRLAPAVRAETRPCRSD